MNSVLKLITYDLVTVTNALRTRLGCQSMLQYEVECRGEQKPIITFV